MAIKISEISKLENPELSSGTSKIPGTDASKIVIAGTSKTHSQDKPVFEKMIRLESNGLQTVFDQYTITETEDSEWMAIDRDEPETDLKKKAEHAHLQKYASFELQGHTLGYQLKNLNLAENPSISVLEEDGSTAEYFVHRLAVGNTVEKGLMAHVLVPKNTKPGNQDIKILFQGSCNGNGYARDAFENGGAGTDSFQANRDLLLLQINGLIKNFKQRMNAEETLSVTISGHSLGGADAQNCMASMMDAAAQNCGLTSTNPIPKECRDGFQAISKLRLATQNSAGITKATAKRADLVAGYLAEQRKKFNKNPAKGKGLNLELETYNLHVAADGVQQTGEAHILSDVSPKLAKVDVMKIQSSWENTQFLSGGHALATIAAAGAVGKIVASTAVGGAVGAAVAVAGISAAGVVGTGISHTAKFFNKPVAAQYERIDNSTRKGRKKVKALLGNKSSWLNGFQNAVLSFSSAVKGLFGSKTEIKDEKPIVPVIATVPVPVHVPAPVIVSASELVHQTTEIKVQSLEARKDKNAENDDLAASKPMAESAAPEKHSSWLPFFSFRKNKEQSPAPEQIKIAAKTQEIKNAVKL